MLIAMTLAMETLIRWIDSSFCVTRSTWMALMHKPFARQTNAIHSWFMKHRLLRSPRVFLYEKERTVCIINRFVKCQWRHHGHVCNPKRDFSLFMVSNVFTMTVHSNCRRICSSTEIFELEFLFQRRRVADFWYAPTNDTFVCPK